MDTVYVGIYIDAVGCSLLKNNLCISILPHGESTSKVFWVLMIQNNVQIIYVQKGAFKKAFCILARPFLSGILKLMDF